METATPPLASAPAQRPTRPSRGPFTRWPRSSDAALAVIVFILEVVGILSRAAEEAGAFDLQLLQDVPLGVYLLLAASSVALLWRRPLPLAALAVTLVAGLVWDLLDYADGPSLAILISLYTVGRYVAVQRTSISAVAAATLFAVADDLMIEGESAGVIGLSIALVFLAWYVGRRVRNRRDYLALLEERAEFLERERAAEAERAAAAERTRIARELHDLVAHRVSMITIQAGAAQTVAASDPEKAMRAMEAVEEAGRDALDELRQVLGVLRADDEPEDTAPMHGVAEIADLVGEMNAAGMDVFLSSDNVPDSLPARVEFASYRIVQESLTNVLKHAGSDARAEVHLSADDRMLNLEVTDRGKGVSTLPGSGQGLVGMRERAALLGGTFEAGPRNGGGFRIMARLPLDRSPS